MNELLQAAAKALSQWLETNLPALGTNWWDELVVQQLTEQQRTQLQRRRISSLAGLDLAALLRVLDQNWRKLGDTNPSLTRDAFTWLKELQGARNRWAHPPAGGIPDTDAFRDADTMERLLKSLGANGDLLKMIDAFKEKRLTAMNPPTSPVPPAADARRELENEQPSVPAAEVKGDHSGPILSDAPAQAVLAITPEPARRVTKVWQSKTGSQYRNIGIDAHVIEVEDAEPTIVLTYVDESGDEQTVEDFGRDGKFEQAVFEYLKDHEGRRAFFILTKKPDDRKAKLASNTMMLQEYRHHWRT